MITERKFGTLLTTGNDDRFFTTYVYDAVGNRTEVHSYRNEDDVLYKDLDTYYTFDELNRLVHVSQNPYSGSGSDPTETSEALAINYELAHDGKRLSATELRRDGFGPPDKRQIDWQYDNLGRLVTESVDATAAGIDSYETTYRYDIVGNRKLMTHSEDGITFYQYNPLDQLTSESGATALSYTYVGTQMTAKGSTTYAYNRQGRMEQSGSEKYLYNADGDRIAQLTTGNALSKVYMVDPQNHTGYSRVREVLNGSGTLVLSYTIGNDVISQATSATDFDIFVYDGHGSNRAIFGNADDPQFFDYDAYGNPLNFPTTPRTSILFSGELTDSSGMQYLRARYYDPATGRFNRLDPFAGNNQDPQSLHKYLYAHANPVMGIDPTGEFLIGVVGALGSSLNIRGVSSQAKVKILRDTSITLGGGAAGTAAGTLLYQKLGLSPAMGGIYGFKVGFGLGFAYTQGRSRLTAALTEGAQNAILRSTQKLTPTFLDVGKGIFDAVVAGGGVNRIDWGKAGVGFVDSAFRGFADGVFAAATEFKQADALYDIIDAGITSWVVALIDGEINDLQSGFKSFASGAWPLALSKGISALVESQGGGEIEDTAAKALAGYVIGLASELAEFFKD